jgi:N-acetylmuramoyl-L-alanine amidase
MQSKILARAKASDGAQLRELKEAAKDRTVSLRKKTRRFRVSTFVSYISIVVLIASILSIGYQSPVEQSAAESGLSRAALAAARPSVDQLAAAEMAASVAVAADLSIASNISTLSISLAAKSELAQTDDNLLSKPQVVEAAGSQGIHVYRTQRGDTVQSVASEFRVSEDSIRWSNDLSSDALRAGTRLLIPGTSGIVYTVRSGDTAGSLASRFRSDANRIITYNNAELSGLKAGQRIVIPGGVQRSTPSTGGSAAPSYSYFAASGYNPAAGNTYAYGYCTWWAFQRRAELGRPIGNFWGDAITWRGFAIASGYTVNNTPAPGAVLYDPTVALPWGHVSIVERVNSNGSIQVSDMNYAGWNVVSYRTISAGQARSYSYIH